VRNVLLCDGPLLLLSMAAAVGCMLHTHDSSQRLLRC
jgi:hypothetical protein